MIKSEQVRPLAPATDRLSSDDAESTVLRLKKIRRKKSCIKCFFGCISALLLILAILVVILIFTVFRVKEPDIKLNSFTITRLELINGTVLPNPGFNMSFIADISMKNPNVASFKYRNTTTGLYYHGTLVGEARGPPGRAKAGRTIRMNITVDIITVRLISNANLPSDYLSGILPIESYSKVGGRVNILNIYKRHVTLTMNCSMTVSINSVNVSSQGIHEQKCKRKVHL